MNTINEIKSWPDGAVVEAIQVTFVESYDRRTVSTRAGDKTVQSFKFRDGTGAEMRGSAWEHPDLSVLKGKELIIHSSTAGNGKRGGVTVRHNKYTDKQGAEKLSIELSVSKLGQFQEVAVYHQTSGKQASIAQPQQDRPAASSGSTGHGCCSNKPFGATIGMAINQVCQNLTARGEMLDARVIWEMASPIVRVAMHMEQGHLYEPAKKEAAKADPAQPQATQPQSAKAPDEDVPF